jgi:hypothetical protein
MSVDTFKNLLLLREKCNFLRTTTRWMLIVSVCTYASHPHPGRFTVRRQQVDTVSKHTDIFLSVNQITRWFWIHEHFYSLFCYCRSFRIPDMTRSTAFIILLICVVGVLSIPILESPDSNLGLSRLQLENTRVLEPSRDIDNGGFLTYFNNIWNEIAAWMQSLFQWQSMNEI